MEIGFSSRSNNKKQVVFLVIAGLLFSYADLSDSDKINIKQVFLLNGM